MTSFKVRIFAGFVDSQLIETQPKSDNTRICDDSKPLIVSKKPLKLLPPLIHTPTIFCVNTEPTDLYMGSVAPGRRATALAKMPRTLVSPLAITSYLYQ